MTTSNLLGVIQHYQKNIERCHNDENRLLHCITKLYKLPINVEHLQETGIGKTVNSLRKYDGEIGVAAKALVTKWKAMVAAEEEPTDAHCQNAEEELPKPKSSSDDEDNKFEKRYDHNQNTSTQIKQQQKDTNKQQSSTSTIKNHQKFDNKDEYRNKNSINNANEHKKNTSHHNTQEKSEQKNSSNSTHKSNRTHHSKNDKPDGKRDKEKHRSSHGDTKYDSHSESNKKDKRRESTSSHHRNGDKRKREQETEKGRKERKIDVGNSDNSKSCSSSHARKEEKSEKSSREKNKSDKQNSSKSSPSYHNSTSQNSASKHASPQNYDKKSADNSKSDRKRHRSNEDCESESKSHKINTSKHNHADTVSPSNNKKKKTNYRIDDDGDENGIDSSTGVNFADVLGMLNMPTKKSKKSTNPTKSSNSSSKEKFCYNSSKNGLPVSIHTSPISEKPSLLSSSTKLEPLDPSIALALPTISANYKPMPLNQTVMDCVFNTNNSSVSKAQMRVFNDADALSHGISSKTMRTKIYSGVRSGQLLQVPSLFDLCIRVLQKNIDALEYTGGVPFEVLRPVLIRATPQQLLQFEEYNPYLMEDSDILWQAHVQRNYRTAKRQEMESWREMYLRCHEDQERKLSSLAQSIKQSQKIIAEPVRKTKLAFVDVMVKPPRNIQRKQEQFGTQSKVAATPAARVASLSNLTPNAAKPGDTRLRVATSVRDTAQATAAPLRSKKAPLMAKTLQFMRGRLKR